MCWNSFNYLIMISSEKFECDELLRTTANFDTFKPLEINHMWCVYTFNTVTVYVQTTSFGTFKPLEINHMWCVHVYTFNTVIVYVQTSSTLSNHLKLITCDVYIHLIQLLYMFKLVQHIQTTWN